MTAEMIEKLEAELKEQYPGATSARDGARTLVKLPKVYLPPGCKPEATESLVALDPGAPKPELFIRSWPTLPNGAQPSSSAVTVAGESWFTYSFNVRWDEQRHTALQFVEGKFRRFALNA